MAVTPEPQQETSALIAAQLDRAAQRFEAAWRRGQQPLLEDYLPTSAAERQAVLVELIHLDLDYRLKAGEGVRLESYLERYGELAEDQASLLDLIAREYELLRRGDVQLVPEAYARRFPQHRAAILARLGMLAQRTVTHLETQAAPPAPVAPLPTAALTAAAELVAVLRDNLMLKAAQLEKLELEVRKRPARPAAVAEELVRHGWLTAYQAEQILQGKGRELVVGPYLVLEPIGQGGMGHVYKARHHVMRRTVALKVIRAERSVNPRNIVRFQREAEALAQLSHPNIVVAYDAGVANNVHFFAMEYVEGADLGRLLKEQGRLPPAQACDYARQAALGLQHAHERGLVHRDIKPSNLLLTSTEGAIKLLDLGLARLLYDNDDDDGKNMTRIGTLMGTLDYLSPEQAQDSHSADIRSDIYSLGCTLHHLLAGQPPFPGGDLEQKLTAHRQAPPPNLEASCPELPDGLGALVRRLLAKRPEKRWQTPGEVAEALTPYCLLASVPNSAAMQRTTAAAVPQRLSAAVLGQATVVVAPPLALSKQRQPLRRLSLGAGALVLCGLLACMLWTQLGEQAEPPQTAQAETSATDKDSKAQHSSGRQTGVVPGDSRLRHDSEVVVVSFSGDGKRIASASKDGIVKIWDADTRQELRELPRLGTIPTIAFDPSGPRLATAAGTSIKLWDADTGRELLVIPGHATAVTVLAFHPRGGELATGSLDGAVRTWRTDTGKPLRQLMGHSNRVQSVAYDAAGERLVSCSNDATKVWDMRTGEPVISLRQLKGGGPSEAVLSPDGKYVVTRGPRSRVARWLVETGVEDGVPAALKSETNAVVFSPDGKRVACAGNGHVSFWDFTAGKKKAVTRGEQGGPRILALAFSPDGSRLLTGGEDGRLHLWDASAGGDLSVTRTSKQ